MALPSWYNQVDQDIYTGGDKFITQEPYRLGYTPKNLSYTSTGITGAQAAGPYRRYPPQGGGDDQEWNAVKPVYENYWQGANFPGAQKAPGMGKDFIGPSFSPNFQSQFDQRYADHMRTVENPDAYNRDADGNLTTRKDINQRSLIAENWDKKYVPDALRVAAGFIPFGNAGLNLIEKRMNDPSRGIGNYGIGGMDASQKGMYDTLASQGLLYDTGNTGFKTATGKNFNAKGYAEGQADIWEKNYAGKTEKQIIEELEDKAKFHNQKNWKDMYLGKKYLEAKAAKYQKDKNIIHGSGDGTGGGKKSEGITEDIHGNPWDSQSHAQDMADQYAGGDVAQYNEDIANIYNEGGRVGYNRGRVVNPGGYQGEEEKVDSVKHAIMLEQRDKLEKMIAAGLDSDGRLQARLDQLLATPTTGLGTGPDLVLPNENPDKEPVDIPAEKNWIQKLLGLAQGGRAGYFDGGIAGLL